MAEFNSMSKPLFELSRVTEVLLIATQTELELKSKILSLLKSKTD